MLGASETRTFRAICGIFCTSKAIFKIKALLGKQTGCVMIKIKLNTRQGNYKIVKETEAINQYQTSAYHLMYWHQ